ncbi:MAG: nucleotidyltransferase domain-containing protein [Eubacteriales bacterium]|nr:nucleotidyltransferase domain-containing protein [Eubacteriales bacterium]
MKHEQQQAFWDTIKTLHEVGILPYIMLIGSWAEYLYPYLFDSEFEPNIRTRDVDFFYRNLKLPDEPVRFVEAMKQNGFLYQVDTISEVARFYKEDLLEIEFLTKVIGSGSQSVYLIKGLGIKAEGLRIINILDDYATEVTRNGYRITVPLPAAYVVQKLLANPTRVPASKKAKDIASVLNLVEHIKASKKHREDLNRVLSGLTQKQRIVLDKVVKENNIDLGL